MTTLHALNRSSHQEYGYSPPRQKVSETEYWEKYYNSSDVVYEWNNGYLEEKAMSDFSTILVYDWFLELLGYFLKSHPIGKKTFLEMGFRLNLPGETDIRKPDLAVVLNDNPEPILPDDKTYQGIFDFCVEVLSDSTAEIKKRDTVTKKKEYAMCGVKEYYILDARREQTQFYRLGKKGVYIPIKPVKGDIIKSKVLPGFQFRISDLFRKPSPEEMINDKVYQDFVLPRYTQEKRARKKAEQRIKQLAEKLRELGVDPDKI